jgi:hypothetical protein
MRSKRARRERDENRDEEKTPETETEVETTSEPENVSEVVTAKVEEKPATVPVSNVPAPPPPDIGATPEDILGLQVQMLDPADLDGSSQHSDPAPQQADTTGSESELTTPAGASSAPMEYYEERAAMAKEVLRAGSDHPRIARRKQKVEQPITEVSDKPEESQIDSDPNDDDDIRVSDDVMITASKRDRRKLFGR